VLIHLGDVLCDNLQTCALLRHHLLQNVLAFHDARLQRLHRPTLANGCELVLPLHLHEHLVICTILAYRRATARRMSRSLGCCLADLHEVKVGSARKGQRGGAKPATSSTAQCVK
jgi:hypothetical protein